MSKKRKIISLIIIIVLASALVGIILYYTSHVKDVERFNAEGHTVCGAFVDKYITDDTIPDLSSDNVTLNLRFRGGNADTWVKESAVSTHAFADLVGSIYELVITNSSEYSVSDWTVRINIHQGCYINNAWCGQVEIHQFDKDGAENVQTLDLQSLEESQITLDYIMHGTDILIPLTDGDYLIYYPNSSVNEAPIPAPSDYNTGVINCGIIYYYWEGGMQKLGGMDLSDAELTYHYHKEINEGEEYERFLYMLTGWICSVLVFIIVILISIADAKKLAGREKFIDEALTVFTHFVDAKDPYTKGHSNRVAVYAEALARALGFSEAKAKNVYYIALLHDVGKCYIDDNILKKPTQLNHDEFEQIKHHTTLGAHMLEDFKTMPDIYDGALYHHERYDGTGYPTGRSGEDIPLIARIICVVDSFDAMNSDRCYRPRLAPDVIIAEIRNNRGTQFDPEIADVFLKLLEDGTVSFD